MSEQRDDKSHALTPADLAAEEFVQTVMVPKADYLREGFYPMWYGWALRDAFHAGAAFTASHAPQKCANSHLPHANGGKVHGPVGFVKDGALLCSTCYMAASAPSTTPQKPRGAYVPLTEHEIDLIRACLDDGTYTKQEQKDIGLLCNMATNCLLYAQEIDRLRSLPSATGTITVERAEAFAQAEVEDFRQRAAGMCEQIAERREQSAKEYVTACPSKASLSGGATALRAAAYQIREKPHNVCYVAYKPNNRPDGGKQT